MKHARAGSADASIDGRFHRVSVEDGCGFDAGALGHAGGRSLRATVNIGNSSVSRQGNGNPLGSGRRTTVVIRLRAALSLPAGQPYIADDHHRLFATACAPSGEAEEHQGRGRSSGRRRNRFRFCRQVKPDIVLMDISMSELNDINGAPDCLAGQKSATEDHHALLHSDSASLRNR